MRSFILALLLLSAAFSSAQENETFYLFDANWKPMKNMNKARFFLHVQKLNDTCWQWDYYNYIGPRLRTESYSDAEGKTPNGFFAYYNKDGYLDSCGYVVNWKKDRYWTYFRGDGGKVYMRKTYDHGNLLKSEDYALDEEKRDTSEGKTFAKVEVESDFSGGVKSWQKYLITNLMYPERAINSGAQGMVWVLFIVDTQGKVIEPVIAKSVEFSLDEEALRLIQLSPDWTPALQNGKTVKSYKKQPIVFRIE